MNELRSVDLFAIEAFDDTFRTLMQPWKLDLAETAPRIKIDVTEQEGSFGVKAEIPACARKTLTCASTATR